jgi:protocatechuate 3,4-dioxygenase beta subunit
MWRGREWMMLRSVIGATVLAIAAGGQQTAARAPVARPRFGISGTVVDALNGQALRETEVAIGPAQKPGSRTVITDDAGRFQFDGLAPGKYWLAAQRRGYSRQNFNQHEEYSTAIAVGTGLHSEGLIFRLHRDASLSGTITDETNEPIRGAQVMLFKGGLEDGERTTRSRAQALADDQGRYHFGHLRPGTYFVAVSARPWYAQNAPVRSFSLQGQDSGDGNQAVQLEEKRSPLDVAYPITFYADTVDASAATPVTLQEGDRAIADVSLTALPALHLHIKGVNQEPGAGFAASLVQPLFDGSTIQVPGQAAVFNNDIEITGAPPGEFEINLQSYGKNSRVWTRTVNLSEDGEINVGEGSASPTISGVVRLNGIPAPRTALIWLWNKATGDRLSAQVTAKGEFQIQNTAVKPGRYLIGVANLPGVAVSGVSASGARAVGQSVDVSGGGTIRMTVLLSKRLGRVDGVALRDGKPVAGVMVVLVPGDIEDNAPLIRRDQSDSDGTFSLLSVVPGRYTVVAVADGWDLEWAKSSVLKPFLKNGEPVEVSGSAREQIKVKVQ